ncbi:hypothetical protein ID866_10001 [Astraeus odoratus]|nr:hypothetical protein ID866_10001 [Astraeus odoratus]
MDTHEVAHGRTVLPQPEDAINSIEANGLLTPDGQKGLAYMPEAKLMAVPDTMAFSSSSSKSVNTSLASDGPSSHSIVRQKQTTGIFTVKKR